MAQPKVSIIVPVYNVEKYLERCVQSLRNQTLRDIEILLVDDEATDSSPQLCDAFAKQDARIRVFHKQNEGVGMARNTALNEASGEYIGFVDSDDFVELNMFETLYEKAEKYRADLVMSGVLFVDGNMFSKEGECICKSYFQEDTVFETSEELYELRLGIIGALPNEPDDSKYGMSIWKNLFRHEVIRQNNLAFRSERTIFSEDGMFMMEFISHIRKAVGIPEAFYSYCRNGDSLSKSYRTDRFEKGLAFIDDVEKNVSADMEMARYVVYIDRFWQAFCRVLCSQEILHAIDVKLPFSELKKRLKAICTHERTVVALKRYPLGGLPLKQRVFAYGMKWKAYRFLKLLVGLRNG